MEMSVESEKENNNEKKPESLSGTLKTYKRTYQKSESEFVYPKKTVKVTSLPTTTVSTSNYFTPLSTTQTAPIDIPTTSGCTSKNDQNKKSKNTNPPPLVIEKKSVTTKLLVQLKDMLKSSYNSTYNTQGVRVQTTTYEDFNVLQYYLTTNKIQYFTYQKTADLPVKVVIKGLPPTTTEEEIMIELQSQQYPVLSVRQFKKLQIDPHTEERIKVPLPMWVISIHNHPGIKEKIKSLTGLFHLTIKIEEYSGSSRPIQCYRCQRFGHKAQCCNLQPKCVKCAGSHFTNECSKDPSTPATCTNCNGSHPANFRQCPRFQAYVRAAQPPEQPTSPPPPISSTTVFPTIRSRGNNIPGLQSRNTQESSNTMDDIKEILTFMKSFNVRHILHSLKDVFKEVSKQKDTLSKCISLMSGICSIFANDEDN